MLWQILSAVSVLLITRALWRRWKYDLHKVPSPPGLPFLGQTLDVLYGEASRNMSRWMQRCRNKTGNPLLMKISVVGKDWLVVADMHFIRNVMMSRKAAFPKFIPRRFGLQSNRNSPRDTLTSVTDVTPYVKELRRVYLTAFNSKNLRIAMPKVIGIVDKLISMMEARRTEGPFDLQSLFQSMTLNITGDVAFDLSAGGQDDISTFYNLMVASVRLQAGSFYNPFKRLSDWLFTTSEEAQKRKALIDAREAEWDKMLKKILDRDDPPKGEGPIWFSLKTLKDPETNDLLDPDTLRAELSNVVFNGVGTTARQLAWIFALLSSHPDVVAKILAELKEHGIYGLNARDLSFDDLGELEYLTAVIKEGMRLAYIFPSTFRRRIPQDMTILGYRIPKGTLIICPGTRVMNIKEEWEDPNAFKPERWLTNEDLSYKYSLAFSYGPRNCVGQSFAKFVMRVVIIKLLTQFQFTLEGSLTKIFNETVDEVMIRARDGIRVHITPRRPTVEQTLS